MSNIKNVEDISVVIPTYNRCDLLKRAICSVLNQTIKIKEIILIDNGSTDNTYEMISSLFPKITYIYQKKREKDPYLVTTSYGKFVSLVIITSYLIIILIRKKILKL